VIVDSHVHLWNLERSGYPWMSGAFGAIARTFESAELEAELRTAGVDLAILVQADNSREDTELMLEIAAAHEWVAGVVGWTDLEHPDALDVDGLVGVRDLVHSMREPDWLLESDVQESLRLLAERGVVFELPDSYPGFLRHVPALAEAAPGLTIVVDHLGKPPFDALAPWEAQLRAAAEPPQVVAKVSGLWYAHDARPAFEVALDAFGPERLMYGSDWPVAILGGGYRRVWEQTLELLDETNRAAILGGNAARIYGLDAQRRTS
jgi:L-fuconolactonase